MSASESSRACRNGSPCPDGPATRSSGACDSRIETKRVGSASAKRVEYDSSRNRRPSSSPHTSIVTVPGSTPMTRGIGSPGRWNRGRSRRRLHELPRHVADRLGVQDEGVALEQPGDAPLVHLHLEIPDAERAENLDAVAVDTGVRHLDAFDA